MKAFISVISATTMAATPCLAQLDARHIQSASTDYNLQAGVRLTVPFGSQVSKTWQEETKFHVSISTTSSTYRDLGFERTFHQSDLFAIGLSGTAQPLLEFGGQDLSRLAFPTAYAAEGESDSDENQTEEPANNGITGGLIIAGGLVFLGGAFLLAADDFDDAING